LRRCESLPDMAGTFGISQDQASWILTTYISALLFGVPLSIWMAGRVRYLHYIIGSTTSSSQLLRLDVPQRRISRPSCCRERFKASPERD
ncbi:MAG: hypothetical protein WBE90_03585, partial [Xanthobacteraceae bacterium]